MLFLPSLLPDRAHWRRSGKKRGVPHVFCAHPEWLTARKTCTTPLPTLGGPVKSYHNTPLSDDKCPKEKKKTTKKKPKKAHLAMDASSMLYKECVYSSFTSIILTL